MSLELALLTPNVLRGPLRQITINISSHVADKLFIKRKYSASLVDCEPPAFKELSAPNIQGTATLEESISAKLTLSVRLRRGQKLRILSSSVPLEMPPKRLTRNEYTVGWICALPIELAAAAEMLDEEHQDLPQDSADTNSYSFGRIGEHNVLIACLPAGQIGNNSAAAVASQMKSRFPLIRFGLMVGIGGGVPSAEVDIRLGDVVISQPYSQHGGVVQYDFGKTGAEGRFTRTGSLNAPPSILLTALSKLRSNYIRGRVRLSEHLSPLVRLPDFAYQGAEYDTLYKPTYDHAGGITCANCTAQELVVRIHRPTADASLYFGTIASGNQVMKDGVTRDRLSAELGGILCFEMEAAGLMNNFPCLVIRGICDYADSHKNKRWQPYAAATAAGSAKELLNTIPGDATAG